MQRCSARSGSVHRGLAAETFVFFTVNLLFTLQGFLAECRFQNRTLYILKRNERIFSILIRIPGARQFSPSLRPASQRDSVTMRQFPFAHDNPVENTGLTSWAIQETWNVLTASPLNSGNRVCWKHLKKPVQNSEFTEGILIQFICSTCFCKSYLYWWSSKHRGMSWVLSCRWHYQQNCQLSTLCRFSLAWLMWETEHFSRAEDESVGQILCCSTDSGISKRMLWHSHASKVMVSFYTPSTQCFSEQALNFSSLKDKCQDYGAKFLTNVVWSSINLYILQDINLFLESPADFYLLFSFRLLTELFLVSI